MCKIEFLNQVKLRGIIGRVITNQFNGRTVNKFSVVTEYASIDHSGAHTIETTWFNITSWEDPGKKTEGLEKGAAVELEGRFRVQRYTRPDGSDGTSYDILAQNVKVLGTVDSYTPTPTKS